MKNRTSDTHDVRESTRAFFEAESSFQWRARRLRLLAKMMPTIQCQIACMREFDTHTYRHIETRTCTTECPVPTVRVRPLCTYQNSPGQQWYHRQADRITHVLNWRPIKGGMKTMVAESYLYNENTGTLVPTTNGNQAIYCNVGLFKS